MGGNAYTAMFWEYDPRTGRRWNVGPVKKPWQSDYSIFSNNPVCKIDPDGDDDFFNADGTFSYGTKTGSKIYVQTYKGNLLLTQVKLNTLNDRQIVANVVAYYAGQVGIKYQGKGSTGNSNKGIVGLKASEKASDVNLRLQKETISMLTKKMIISTARLTTSII